MVVEKELSIAQQRLLSVLPSIGACISILCALRIIVRVITSHYARTRLYYRLMAGGAVSVIIQSISWIWGPFGVPEGTPNFIHARGTTTTCSMVGFLAHSTSLVVPSCYFALSIVAYYLVIHKVRDPKKQLWMEKWIHLAVYIFPVSSGIYLLKIEAFNPIVRHCAVASSPLGCGDQSPEGEYEECTRGPQNIGTIQWYLSALPALIVIICPTLLLMILYCRVRGEPHAASVAKQSAWFLFVAVYWTYLFSAIDAALLFKHGEFIYISNLLANIVYSLQGLWIILVYWYFRSDGPSFDRSGDLSRISQKDVSQPLSASLHVRTTLATFKPEFSIFDGTNTSASNSPWSASLYDDGEDEEYIQDCGEYEDRDFSSSLGGILVSRQEDVVVFSKEQEEDCKEQELEEDVERNDQS